MFSGIATCKCKAGTWRGSSARLPSALAFTFHSKVTGGVRKTAECKNHKHLEWQHHEVSSDGEH
eukprot:1156209-Pelagomonas_calceolata.AAC.4